MLFVVLRVDEMSKILEEERLLGLLEEDECTSGGTTQRPSLSLSPPGGRSPRSLSPARRRVQRRQTWNVEVGERYLQMPAQCRQVYTHIYISLLLIFYATM